MSFLSEILTRVPDTAQNAAKHNPNSIGLLDPFLVADHDGKGHLELMTHLGEYAEQDLLTSGGSLVWVKRFLNLRLCNAFPPLVSQGRNGWERAWAMLVHSKFHSA